MSDSEKSSGSAKVFPIRTPSAADEKALGEIAAERKAKATKAKGKEKPAVEAVTFKSPAEALAEVVKAKAAEDRADAARTKVGKEHGQILKSRKASLAGAVEGIEGRSTLAVEMREAFEAIAASEEKAKESRAKAKARRAKLAEELDALDSDAPDWAKKIKRAWAAVEAAKEEASQAKGDAKRKLAAAGDRFSAVIDGARQLALPI